MSLASSGSRWTRRPLHAYAAHEKERQRVDAYYQSIVDSIAERRRSAGADRARLYDAQEDSSRSEWARRLHELEEQFAGSFEIRPFRLQLLGVPSLSVPATIRRGARAYPFRLVFLLAQHAFAPLRCPSCAVGDQLVAGRDRLGCRDCLSAAPSAVLNRAVDLPPAADAAGEGGVSPAAAPGERAADEVTEAVAAAGDIRDESRRSPRHLSSVSTSGSPADVRSAKLVESRWKALAQDFWRSVARGERFPAVAPRSPLATLYRCYGPFGPLCAVGLDPFAHLSAMRALSPEGDPGGILATSGALSGSGLNVPFTLRWRLFGKNPSIVEVLPFRSVDGSASKLASGLGISAAQLRSAADAIDAVLGSSRRAFW